MSKNIEQIVAETFEKFPTENTLYSTADGNVFIDENRAQLHAGVKGKYTIHTRVVDQKTLEPKKKTAQEIIAEIKEVTTLEALQEYVADEERKSVLKAIEERTAELTASLPENAPEIRGEEFLKKNDK